MVYDQRTSRAYSGLEPLHSTNLPRWLGSAVKLDSTSAIKKGWTGADVIRGRAVIASVFLSISGNGDKFISDSKLFLLFSGFSVLIKAVCERFRVC
jgi:hypothetical protein